MINKQEVMGNRQKFLTELTELITEVAGLKASKLRPEARLIEDLGLDSFAATELLVAVEQRYRISISESDLRRNKTIGDWAKLISARCRRSTRSGLSSTR